MEVEWFGEVEDPRRNQVYDWKGIAEQCRAHEGKWGLFFKEGLASTVVAIREGKVKHLKPEDGFRVLSRNNTFDKPRRCDIYIAYKPTKE